RTDRGVTLQSPDRLVTFELAEHLLSAFGGLGVRRGVRVTIEGGEVPLLDGGARAFADALQAIRAPAGEPAHLAVARPATLEHGASVYRFLPAKGEATRLTVSVVFRAPVGEQSAAWAGDGSDFHARIASARTFGWRDEYGALLATGRARGVDLSGVL